MVGRSMAALLGLSLASVGAYGATPPCPHGSLDTRYCDRNGDLIADPPDDPAATNDPKTLIFAYTPVEDPGVYKKTWAGFLEHLQRITGKPVTFFAVQSNAAEIEAMRAGRLHVAAFNTGSVPFAVNAAGFVPLFTMAFPDGRAGYQMQLVVRGDSPIKEVVDLRGRSIAFSSPTSNSGYKAPVHLLRTRFKLEPDKDYKSSFSGKHDNTILGVINGDYDVGAVASVVWRRMIDRGEIPPDALRAIYSSETFPSTAYGVAHTLPSALIAKIKRAFETFDWTGSALLTEYKHGEGTSFIPVDYKRMWEPVRVIDAALGVDYLGKP